MINILIVGRTNVGKSTLFNALIGRNFSIVDRAPGTTRDPVYFQRHFKNVCFNFIDSAGIGFESMEIYKKAKEQTLSMLYSADIILFVVDAKTPLTNEDFYINKILYKSVPEKTVLVINKVDNDEILRNIDQFKRLKYNYTFLTSAVCKKGVREIVDFLCEKFKDVPPEDYKENEAIKVAIIGKRGVGKSSYLNAIFNKEVRLVSSQSPTTRDIGMFEYSIFNANFILYDTAGLFKIKSNSESADFHAVKKVYNLVKEVDVVFLILDITNYDTQFDKYLCKLLIEAKKLTLLIFNKIDLLSQKNFEKEKKDIDRKFPFLYYVPKIFLSAKKKVNIWKPFELAVDLYNQAKTRLQTSVLNKIIARIASKKVFKIDGKIGKVYYVTQVGVLPIQLALFVNNKYLFKPSDLKFIENSIRKETGLFNVPISLKLIDKKTSG